jgi:tubulin epsilon
MRSPLGSLFDETQFIKDVSGSGNNFGHGNREWGPIYRASIEEGLRKNAEHCDSLQTFVLTHSLGGGTGSGLGTYVLAMLEDLFPEVYRFTVSVFPSEDSDDVITSPYNSILATKELIDHAHCSLPIDNHSLQLFAKLESEQKAKSSSQSSRLASSSSRSSASAAPTAAAAAGLVHKRAKDRGFNEMNGVAARMICHLTASSRFHGDMNVDLNEICTNLVPYPRLHFLMTSLSPYRAVSSSSSAPPPPRASQGLASLPVVPKTMIQRAFTDLLSSHGQISASIPSGGESVPHCLPSSSHGSRRQDHSRLSFLGSGKGPVSRLPHLCLDCPAIAPLPCLEP